MEGQTFPQLCQQLFGITLPKQANQVDIEGWVLCLSMSEAKPFGPYHPNEAMLALCWRTAERLWDTTQAITSGQAKLDDVPYCTGFHPLCDWCDHAESCPKFKAEPVNDPTLDQQLTELAQLKTDRAKIETAIEGLEERIRQFYRHACRDTGWLSTKHFRFRTSQIPGRKTIDRARLRAELTNRIGEAGAEAVLTNATTIGNGYERLTVSPTLPQRL